MHKKILLGITGGIAAYKMIDGIRLLREKGCDVKVVLTQSAHTFVTPLTLQAISGNPVYTDLFDDSTPDAMRHIDL